MKLFIKPLITIANIPKNILLFKQQLKKICFALNNYNSMQKNAFITKKQGIIIKLIYISLLFCSIAYEPYVEASTESSPYNEYSKSIFKQEKLIISEKKQKCEYISLFYDQMKWNENVENESAKCLKFVIKYMKTLIILNSKLIDSLMQDMEYDTLHFAHALTLQLSFKTHIKKEYKSYSRGVRKYFAKEYKKLRKFDSDYAKLKTFLERETETLEQQVPFLKNMIKNL